MSAAPRLLIVDDERVALRNLEHVMRKEGYHATAASSGQEALDLLDAEPFDVVLTDLRMEKIDGMQVLERARARNPDGEVIMITGFASLDSAVEAMRLGAFHYIAKPFRLDEVRRVVAEAVAKTRLKRENRELRAQLRAAEGEVRIVTRDPAFRRMLETAAQIAPTDCTVLITGESGTGKELMARYVHARSGRASGPFIAVNCGAFNEELLANELFGHARGAYTGAHQSREGLIQRAHGGTLFLDEITEMSPSMQVTLLRVIQEREFYPVGDARAVKVDVRFVAATNRDLAALVRDGGFRQDLYYRLNVVHLALPALAQRRADIAPLVEHFLEMHAARMGRAVRAIQPEALALLEEYPYPGNVRELENIVERGVALCTGDTLGTAELPDDLRLLRVRSPRRDDDGAYPTLERHEREYVEWVLQEHGGNQTRAAQALGIDRVSLWRKLRRYSGSE